MTRILRLIVGMLVSVAALGGALAAPAAALTPYVVTATATPNTGGLGTAFSISGSVPNATAGRTVYLDEFSSGAWRQRFAVRTTANRSFLFPRQRPSAAGLYKFRVRTPGSAVHSAGVSSTVSVSIFRWIKLTEYKPIAGFANSAPDTRLAGDVYFSKYWILERSAPGPVSVTYDLKRRCTNFRVTLGVDEGSLPGANSSRMQVALDTTTVLNQVFSTGDALYRMFPLTGRSQLRLSAQAVSYNTRNYSMPAFGGPEIRCSF